MLQSSRPLSPHLQVYRFMYTMATSILHRLTGIALSVALALLAGWLVALASGPDAYEAWVDLLGGAVGRLLSTGLLAAFWYHTCAGIRHLFWDAGIGINKAAARRTAGIIAAATVLLTLVSAWYVWSPGVRL